MDWNEEAIDKCVALIEARLRALFEKTNRLTHPPAPVPPLVPASLGRIALDPFEWPHRKDLCAFYATDQKTHVSLATDADRVEAARRMVHYAQFHPAAILHLLHLLRKALTSCDNHLQHQEAALIRFQDYDEARRQCLAKQFLEAADSDAKFCQTDLVALEALFAD